jgi:hypothetical protein
MQSNSAVTVNRSVTTSFDYFDNDVNKEKQSIACASCDERSATAQTVFRPLTRVNSKANCKWFMINIIATLLHSSSDLHRAHY